MTEKVSANQPKNFLMKIISKMVRNSLFWQVCLLRLSSFFPKRFVLFWRYRLITGRFPNVRNPKRLTEKIQWYKLNYHDPLMVQCADKYSVREFVTQRGLGHILNELYHVYDKVDDVNFDELPEKFVMKTTNSSATNIFCPDRSKLNVPEVKRQLNLYVAKGKIDIAGEWAYRGIKNRIIVERFRTDPTNADGSLNDYKFFCFNGRTEFFVVDLNRYSGHQRNFYDRNGNFLEVYSDRSCSREAASKNPENLDEMVEIAERLASGFPFVRVDLYNIAGEIMFGEMTFYPWSGNVRFTPDSFDFEMGEKFVLPDIRK